MNNIKEAVVRFLDLLRHRITMMPKQCPGCHIWTGGIESSLTNYRGVRICSWCIENWKRKEAREGRKLSFLEYRGEDADLRKIGELEWAGVRSEQDTTTQ